MKNQEVFEALETLAAACPWDNVDIWVRREPAGRIQFTAYVSQNEKFGFTSECGWGDTPMQAAATAIESCEKHGRDPEIARRAKIAEMQSKVEALQKVVIGLPPYRPNRELAEVNPIEVPKTIDV